MAISRITTWADGQVLTAAALNAEFDNILNNATALVSPLTANLAFNFFRANQMRLDGQSGYTITTTNNTGRLAYYTPGGEVLISRTDTGPFIPVGPSINQPTRVSGLDGSISSASGGNCTFQALGYTLRTTMGLNFGVSASSAYSINTQTAGPAANGRDQAAAFTSTQVHFYVIATGIGSTAPQGLVSSNPPPTGPTLPSGYVGWGYLASAIYTPGSSAVTRGINVSGHRAQIDTAVTLLSGGSFVSTRTAVGCGTAIPTIATRMVLEMGVEGYSSLAGNQIDQEYSLHALDDISQSFHMVNKNTYTTGVGAAATVNNVVNQWAEIPNFETTPTVYYLTTINNSGGINSVDIKARGYILPNGDV